MRKAFNSAAFWNDTATVDNTIVSARFPCAVSVLAVNLWAGAVPDSNPIETRGSVFSLEAIRREMLALNAVERRLADLPQFLDINDVMSLTRVKRSTLYLHVKQGLFPAPYRLGGALTRWREDEVRAHLEGLTRILGPAANDNRHAPVRAA